MTASGLSSGEPSYGTVWPLSPAPPPQKLGLGDGGIDQVTPLKPHYSATPIPQANPCTGYNSQMDIHIIHPTHPHLSSRKLLPNALLGSGIEVFTPVSLLPPHSCCRYEEANHTPTANQALKQAMCGMVAHPHLSHTCNFIFTHRWEKFVSRLKRG